MSTLGDRTCLVYLFDNNPTPNTEGITCLAEIVERRGNWYDLLLITDKSGAYSTVKTYITVSSDRIISNRAIQYIRIPHFYYFNQKDSITATGFVFKKLADSSKIKLVDGQPTTIQNTLIPKYGLLKTDREALGSGIVGKYLDKTQLRKSKLKGDIVFKIDATYCYFIQDKEHGESLKRASLATNNYLDNIINAAQEDNVEVHSILSLIKNNDGFDRVFNLWNITFMRSNETVNKNKLQKLLANYVVYFMTNKQMIDSRTEEYISVMPINWIMQSMKYNGLVATNDYSNGTDRGCISYDLDIADELVGSIASY
jgi:hypothetical protein